MLKIISILLLVMMQLFLSVAHSAQKEEVSEGQRHKLPMQRFMVYVEKPGYHSLDILVKRKYPYIENMSVEYRELHHKESSKILMFIKKISGVIVVYNFNTREKILEYKLPFTVDNPDRFCCSQFYWGVNGDLWDGMTLTGGELKNIGRHMIYADLYTESDEYDEYVLMFRAARGFK
ncbi:hypothetical protein ACG0Z5_03065 [Scandinavium sp. M-37]|uniref:hypothetical protein n=1 Tax=Scandinavium sp. M-37 TaxID=3373077 RepID=UPI0037458268